MTVTKPNVMYKKNFLDTIAETMFNNKHHSDVTLVVNKTHYYACKIVMSVASEVFASLISEHFNNCMDQEVLVPGVIYNESFLNILRYWHHENIIDHVSASDNVIDSQVDISKIEDTCSDKCVTKTASTFNDNNSGYNVLNIKNKNLKQSTEGVVEIFSENVLNTLLKQIRFKKISMLDFIDIKQTETFAKYIDGIENVENKFAINEIKRKKYSGGFTTNFTVKGISKGNIEETKKYYSEEIYSSENYKWKIYLKKATQPETGTNISDEKYFSLYLSCTSIEENWEFTTNAQITLISHSNFHVDYSLKFDKPRTYSENNSWGLKNFISFSDLFEPNNYFIQNETITVEVIQMPSSTP